MSIFSLLVSFFTLQIFFFSPYMVDGPSMEPSMQSGDMFMVDHASFYEYEFDRGDIVVFTLKNDPGYYYVKRVIGLPGERLQIRDDGIYVGESGLEMLINEPYLLPGAKSLLKTGSYIKNYKHTYNVPDDRYFVMGDNRSGSLDSRYFIDPFISRAQIKGKYIFNIVNL